MSNWTFNPTFTNFICASSSNTAYSNVQMVYVGNYSGINDIYRGIIKFDISRIPIDYTINSAKLLFYLSRNDYPKLSKIISFYRITQNYNPLSVNFANRPAIAEAPEAKTVITDQIGAVIAVDLTSIVVDWYSGTHQNYGLMIKGLETSASIIGFTGIGYPDSRFWSLLTIDISKGTTVQYTKRIFTTNNTISASTPIPLGSSLGTFGIINSGTSNNAYVWLQLSDDQTVWIDNIFSFSTIPALTPGESLVLKTNGHMKYARVAFISEQKDLPAELTIYPSTTSV